MKIYISADIEGTTGITDWEEAGKGHPTYQEFRERMTEEVVAACEGAIEAGAKEILIKDAHDSGRNIIAGRLPDCAKLIRGWSGHPFSMVQELDESFAALDPETLKICLQSAEAHARTLVVIAHP